MALVWRSSMLAWFLLNPGSLSYSPSLPSPWGQLPSVRPEVLEGTNGKTRHRAAKARRLGPHYGRSWFESLTTNGKRRRRSPVHLRQTPPNPGLAL